MRRLPLLRLLACGGLGVLLVLPLQLWMHKVLPGPEALLWGFLGGALPPALLRPIWGDLPDFLGRGLDAAVATTGVLGIALVSVAARGPLYLLLRRDEALGALLSLGLMALGISAAVETHRRLAGVIAQKERELAETRQASVQARLRALEAQIRPHFLFNTFNALSELIHEDADAAEELVTDLAHLLRYSLRSSAAPVTLHEELAAVRRYLRIEQARLGERLRVEFAIEEGVGELLVPALVLQPLVENAVQHGVAPRSEGGRVRVEGAREEDRLILRVSDDGPGLGALPERDASSGAGHDGGLANVRRRLALGFSGAATMAVSSDARGTHITLSLPVNAS